MAVKAVGLMAGCLGQRLSKYGVNGGISVGGSGDGGCMIKLSV